MIEPSRTGHAVKPHRFCCFGKSCFGLKRGNNFPDFSLKEFALVPHSKKRLLIGLLLLRRTGEAAPAAAPEGKYWVRSRRTGRLSEPGGIRSRQIFYWLRGDQCKQSHLRPLAQKSKKCFLRRLKRVHCSTKRAPFDFSLCCPFSLIASAKYVQI